ncbi:sugar-transfer associated ATP-grasp domain-containing protein [Ensifer sp. 2YAB10]|uniref:sugar-transfer associated ATP-grasp domain-containing protein n=1 Tax=unclassified Ensifer TaxID=2633371 RepID=UPI003F93AA38
MLQSLVDQTIDKRRLRFLKSHARRYWADSASADDRQLAPLQRIQDILAGFDPKEADWYRQIRGDLDGVVSNCEREQHLHGLNGHYAYVLDNKAVFGELLASMRLPTPQIFSCYFGDRWHWRDDSRRAFGDELATHGRFVIKPALGSKGRSVQIGTAMDHVNNYRGEDAILTSFVQQADYAQTIFPDALNTIRLLMLRDDDGAPVAAAAIHRFGGARSVPVDNFSAGGLVSKVDLQTGRLSRALSIADGNLVRYHDVHPDTQTTIADVEIAHWPAVLRLVEDLGRAFPYLHYVGWDIAVTPEGPTVIEGNAHPSLRFFQLYDRLLDEPQLRRIFARYIPRAKDGPL